MDINNKMTIQPSVSKMGACMVCDTSEPCVHELAISHGVESVKLSESDGPLNLAVLDKGDGVDVTVDVTSSCICGKKTCPQTTLHKRNRNNTISSTVLIEGTGSKTPHLYFRDPQTTFDYIRSLFFKSLQFYVTSLIADSASLLRFFDTHRRYIVKSEGCCDSKHQGIIQVYPELSFIVNVGFKYDFFSKSDKPKQDDKASQEKVAETDTNTIIETESSIKKGAHQALLPSLPADSKFKNEPPSNVTVPFLGKKGGSIGVELNVAGKSLTAELTKFWSKEDKTESDTTKGLTGWAKLFEYAKKYLLPSPQASSQTREYKVADFTVKEATIGVAYGYERTTKNDRIVGQHFCGLYAAPLFEFEFKIDLLQLIAAYFKVEKIVAKARAELAKQKENGIEFSVDCYLAFTTNVSIKVGGSAIDEWAFYCGEGNKLEFGLIGKIDVEFGVTVLFVEASLNAAAAIATSGGFELEQHDKGLDLVGYHDGIRAYIAVAVEVGMSKKSKDKASIKFEDKKIFEIAAPLKTQDSSFRVNLFGEEKALLEPIIETQALRESSLEGISTPGRIGFLLGRR